jgi:hypothetical protein
MWTGSICLRVYFNLSLILIDGLRRLLFVGGWGGGTGEYSDTLPACFCSAHCKIFYFCGYARPTRIEFYAVSILACAVGLFMYFIRVLSSLKGSDQRGGAIGNDDVHSASQSILLFFLGFNQSELPSHCACSSLVHVIGGSGVVC